MLSKMSQIFYSTREQSADLPPYHQLAKNGDLEYEVPVILDEKAKDILEMLCLETKWGTTFVRNHMGVMAWPLKGVTKVVWDQFGKRLLGFNMDILRWKPIRKDEHYARIFHYPYTLGYGQLQADGTKARIHGEDDAGVVKGDQGAEPFGSKGQRES